MKSTKVHDVSVLSLPKIQMESGTITALNGLLDIPFEVRRCYFLYDIPSGSSRGGHAHKDLHQLIVAASGSFDIQLNDGRSKQTISLNQPDHGLLLPPGLWREINGFSFGAICLVLASELYSEDDYIRSFDAFLNYKLIENAES